MVESYVIGSDGWAQCSVCGRQTKAYGLEATEAAIRRHMFSSHNISFPSDDHDVAPYFIPPDRKGFSPTQSKRFDHNSNLPAERKCFSGVSFNK